MADIYYTDEHEWLSVEDGIATVGITNYAQEQLGDLVFVELPSVGAAIAKGDANVVVESVKAASDVFAPIAGEITAVNDALEGDPALVNSAAESNGWLYKMKVADVSELSSLMDLEAYKALIA
ncbi:MAG: glycine cleavage system protein GcvH [Rhizobiales bacterium]|nr:glycine cleavage system protein GcvH [Hyphomicrobiales bacterium]